MYTASLRSDGSAGSRALAWAREVCRAKLSSRSCSFRSGLKSLSNRPEPARPFPNPPEPTRRPTGALLHAELVLALSSSSPNCSFRHRPLLWDEAELYQPGREDRRRRGDSRLDLVEKKKGKVLFAELDTNSSMFVLCEDRVLGTDYLFRVSACRCRRKCSQYKEDISVLINMYQEEESCRCQIVPCFDSESTSREHYYWEN